MNEKNLLHLARVLSVLLTPFWVPTVATSALLLFSYLRIMPWSFKFLVVAIIYCFTVFMPQFGIYLFRRMNGWTMRQLSVREKRLVPYCMTILSYIVCILLLFSLRIPAYMIGIVIAGLCAIILCAITNIWYKISEHMASVGTSTGLLALFGEFFLFNPIWWICATLIIGGIVGSSRMVLRQHSLGQIVCGFMVGLVASIIGVIYGTLLIEVLFLTFRNISY